MYRQRVGQERLVTIDVTGKDGQHAGYVVWSVYVLQKAGPTWKVVLLDWSGKTARRCGLAAPRGRVGLPGISQGGLVIM